MVRIRAREPESPLPAPSGVLAQLGWDAALADAFAPRADLGDQPGRVSRVDRGFCTVITADVKDPNFFAAIFENDDSAVA